jgi:hypothetical protein
VKEDENRGDSRVCKNYKKVSRVKRAINRFISPWMCVRGPSPPELPVDCTVNCSLTSFLIFWAYQHTSRSKGSRGTNLSNFRTRQEEHHQQYEGKIPWVNSVNNCCQRCNHDAGRSQGFMRPSSVNKCQRCRHSKYRLHVDLKLSINLERLLRMKGIFCTKNM